MRMHSITVLFVSDSSLKFIKYLRSNHDTQVCKDYVFLLKRSKLDAEEIVVIIIANFF